MPTLARAVAIALRVAFLTFNFHNHGGCCYRALALAFPWFSKLALPADPALILLALPSVSIDRSPGGSLYYWQVFPSSLLLSLVLSFYSRRVLPLSLLLSLVCMNPFPGGSLYYLLPPVGFPPVSLALNSSHIFFEPSY